MFGKLISNILAIYKEAFAGQIVNNQLNPLHLAIATTGYHIQSCTLQIPDRLGFFSPGPPRLQAHEGFCFILVVFWYCMAIFNGALITFLSRGRGLPTCQKLGAIYLMMMVPGTLLIWIAAVNDRRRAPGYEWKDWKLRKD
ncbi:hypothetical protein JMJ35_008566 [Cladonia borealis]|uniref:Uncharacterized protein n=1 Tax=Cladonia borealis TaxID=184061 RepID=A0AA39QW58_9LECA|nr:hypothetical protein JMJ35_008566 [Cladonia borealis]